MHKIYFNLLLFNSAVASNLLPGVRRDFICKSLGIFQNHFANHQGFLKTIKSIFAQRFIFKHLLSFSSKPVMKWELRKKISYF